MNLQALEYFAEMTEVLVAGSWDSDKMRKIILSPIKSTKALDDCIGELKNNLYLAETQAQKRSVIIEYMARLEKATVTLKLFPHIFERSSYTIYEDYSEPTYFDSFTDKSTIAEGDEKIAIIIRYLLHDIFVLIKQKCVIEGVDYYDLCIKLDIDPWDFYVGEYEKKLPGYNFDQEEEITESQSFNFEQELAKIKSQENQFWKGLPMEKVIDHFLVMTKNKKGEVLLTEGEFISFLKKGFLGDEDQPKQRINWAKGQKGFVIKRFYEFYLLATTEYEYVQKKENFTNLIINCFEGWKLSAVSSSFRIDITKKQW